MKMEKFTQELVKIHGMKIKEAAKQTHDTLCELVEFISQLL